MDVISLDITMIEIEVTVIIAKRNKTRNAISFFTELPKKIPINNPNFTKYYCITPNHHTLHLQGTLYPKAFPKKKCLCNAELQQKVWQNMTAQTTHTTTKQQLRTRSELEVELRGIQKLEHLEIRTNQNMAMILGLAFLCVGKSDLGFLNYLEWTEEPLVSLKNQHYGKWFSTDSEEKVPFTESSHACFP